MQHTDAAIELVLVLRLVFHLALHQAEGFARSALRLLGQELRVPDRTTLSRRGCGFAGRRPTTLPHGPMHLVIDSTGLKLFGRGEWDAEKHGGRARRSWRKLHIAVDADTGEIVACALTDKGADDAGEVPALLGAIDGAIASVTADGAYDGEPVHQPSPATSAIQRPTSSSRRARRRWRARRTPTRGANATATSGSPRRRAAWRGRGRRATAVVATPKPR